MKYTKSNSISQDLLLALYTSSIIMGAGLLTLPNSAAILGAIPLLFMIAMVGIGVMLIYRRFVGSLFDYLNRNADSDRTKIFNSMKIARNGKGTPIPQIDANDLISEEVEIRGSNLFAELLRSSGLGNSGKFSFVLGMFLYVFLADIGYITLGNKSLLAITEYLVNQRNNTIFWFISSTIITILLGSIFEKIFTRPFKLRGSLKKILVMTGSWQLGILILMVVSKSTVFQDKLESNWILNSMGLVLFTISVLAGMFTHTKKFTSELSTKRGITDQHTVNVTIVILNIILLIATTISIVVIALKHDAFVNVIGLNAGSLNWTLPLTRQAWAKMIGVVIFSFIGTGIFNLCAYPTIFTQSKNGNSSRLNNIVVIGTMIPIVMYLIWTGVSVSVLPSETLIELESAKEFSTIGIYRSFSNVYQGSWIIGLLGYFVSLLSVTSACNGFTESLADQFGVILKEVKFRKSKSFWKDILQKMTKKLASSRDNILIRLILLLAALVFAICVEHLTVIDLSTILAVSGNAGGGLLVLILPFFIPARGQRKSKWFSIILAFTSAIILAFLCGSGINLTDIKDTGTFVVSIFRLIISMSIIAATLWLIISEPEPFSNDEFQYNSFNSEKDGGLITEEMNNLKYEN